MAKIFKVKRVLNNRVRDEMRENMHRFEKHILRQGSFWRWCGSTSFGWKISDTEWINASPITIAYYLYVLNKPYRGKSGNKGRIVSVSIRKGNLNPKYLRTTLGSAPERFMTKVAKLKSGCWYWMGKINAQGYGYTTSPFSSSSQISAHRLSYIFFRRKLKKYDNVLHRCGNRKCVNPEHLYIGTAYDNYVDSVLHGTARNMPVFSDNEVRVIRTMKANGQKKRWVYDTYYSNRNFKNFEKVWEGRSRKTIN
jgi:hypothetical protein